MKKTITYKSELFQQEVTVTVSEELNKLKGKIRATKQLQRANELLRKLKTPLPK